MLFLLSMNKKYSSKCRHCLMRIAKMKICDKKWTETATLRENSNVYICRWLLDDRIIFHFELPKNWGRRRAEEIWRAVLSQIKYVVFEYWLLFSSNIFQTDILLLLFCCYCHHYFCCCVSFLNRRQQHAMYKIIFYRCLLLAYIFSSLRISFS